MFTIAPKVLVRKNLAAKPGAVDGVINSLAVGSALETGQVIRKRVTKGAGTVTRPPPYNVKGGRLVSPRYPERGAGGKVTRGGAIWYPSSALFHAGTRPASFDVSGGMWEGQTIDVRSTRTAIIAFRGRSEGQGMRLAGRTNRREQLNRTRAIARADKRSRGRKTLAQGSKALAGPKIKNTAVSEDPYFDASGRAVPRKVSNALKAATVYQTKGVNVLQPNQEEMRGLVLGAAESVFQGVINQSANAVDPTRHFARTALASAIARRVAR